MVATESVTPSVVVFGCNGPIGEATMRQLVTQGHRVRGVCRNGRAEAPEGVEIVAGDAADQEQAARLSRGAECIISCIGVDYTRWPELWPPIVDGLIFAAEDSGAKLVFADNLYCYGPVEGVLRESRPLTDYGVKPALRARLAERLLDAHASGRARVAIARASDFYGPGVRNSHLGERVFPTALAGKTIRVQGSLEEAHTFTYSEDFALALATLADNDSALGESWHVPSAPALPLHSVLEKIFRLAGTEPRIATMPGWLLKGGSLFVPLLRELEEMSFLWDRPYLVDHTKYASTFGEHFTPLEEGLEHTLAWYRRQAE
jgi:nucleoside-diphosphate-sugar epimerase